MVFLEGDTTRQAKAGRVSERQLRTVHFFNVRVSICVVRHTHAELDL